MGVRKLAPRIKNEKVNPAAMRNRFVGVPSTSTAPGAGERPWPASSSPALRGTEEVTPGAPRPHNEPRARYRVLISRM
jgi:hypothetical protein